MYSIDVLKSGYLYKFRNGKLKEYYGEILTKGGVETEYVDKAYFRVSENSEICKPTTFCVVNKPDKVFNGMIWLEESDIVRAAESFKRYKLRRIDKLNKEIEEICCDIDILVEVIEG